MMSVSVSTYFLPARRETERAGGSGREVPCPVEAAGKHTFRIEHSKLVVHQVTAT